MIVRAAYNQLPLNGADVIDDCSEWMSFHNALAHVEATQKCYEALAIRLLQQATDGQKIGSRTIQSSPKWVQSGAYFYSDDGPDLQFCREDVIKLWPEQQKQAAASRSRTGSGAVSVGVSLALDALYPDGVPKDLKKKELYYQVEQWLKQHGKIVPKDAAKAVQRALRRSRDAS
jgi:hypothetical protein